MHSTLGGANSAEQFVPARQVRARYGVTSMTLWRWLADDKLAFPKPIYIGRYRYWCLSALVAWERALCGKSLNMNVEPLPDIHVNTPVEPGQLKRARECARTLSVGAGAKRDAR
jgi:predicted DNA-binding transcriptional regulator AlpA